jgi:hypothetical protein
MALIGVGNQIMRQISDLSHIRQLALHFPG